MAVNNSSMLGVVYDPRMAAHEDPVDPSHPEQPLRISAIYSELKIQGLLKNTRSFPVSEVSEKDLLRVHTQDWISTCHDCEDMELSDLVFLSQRFDSIYMNESTMSAARLCAGATVDLTVRVAKGECRNGVAIVRPPGHHAEAHCAKGFCFFNNVAVAAAVALKQGVKRILIVDWDVHHGNGTQHMFEADPNVMYFSAHRHDFGKFYPNSPDGAANKVGVGPGRGYNVNVAWNNKKGACAGDADYLYAWQKVLIPMAKQFKPELTIISAGFDAARGDPLGGCDITPKGYAHLTKQLMEITPDGKVVLVLEGGYSLKSISTSFAECVKVLKASLEKTKLEKFNRLIDSVKQKKEELTTNMQNKKKKIKSKHQQAETRQEDVKEEEDDDDDVDESDYLNYIPPPYDTPIAPSQCAINAVRTTIRYHKHIGLLFDSNVPIENSSVTYSTKPLVLPRAPGSGGWAFCYVSPLERLHSRFGKRRWRKSEFSFLGSGEDDEEEESIHSSDLSSIESEESFGNEIQDDDEQDDVEETSVSDFNSEGDEEDGYLFHMPQGVELVNSTDSFTPYEKQSNSKKHKAASKK